MNAYKPRPIKLICRLTIWWKGCSPLHAAYDEPIDDDFPTLEEIVAMIKATPPNPNAVHLPTKTAAELIAELEADPPEPSDITPDEWDRLWAAFEAELKAADYAAALSEGRL